MTDFESNVNKIVCGDCLEVMKDWPDNCVDLVLTDPPYGINIASWDTLPMADIAFSRQIR